MIKALCKLKKSIGISILGFFFVGFLFEISKLPVLDPSKTREMQNDSVKSFPKIQVDDVRNTEMKKDDMRNKQNGDMQNKDTFNPKMKDDDIRNKDEDETGDNDVHDSLKEDKSDLSQIDSNSKSFKDMSMKERIEEVKKRCEHLRSTGKIKAHRENQATFFVDEVHKIMACSNLKAASSTIALLFYQMQNVNPGWKKYRTEYLQKTIPAKDVNSMQLIKFMFVREPLSKISSLYRQNWGAPKVNGTKIPFEQFVDDIGSYKNYTFENHHTSSLDRCRPCDIDYTYIGTVDTIDRDLVEIMKTVDFNMDSVPKINAHNSATHLDFLFKKLTKEHRHGIFKRYRHDYFLFGYPHP